VKIHLRAPFWGAIFYRRENWNWYNGHSSEALKLQLGPCIHLIDYTASQSGGPNSEDSHRNRTSQILDAMLLSATSQWRSVQGWGAASFFSRFISNACRKCPVPCSGLYFRQGAVESCERLKALRLQLNEQAACLTAVTEKLPRHKANIRKSSTQHYSMYDLKCREPIKYQCKQIYNHIVYIYIYTTI
jgi:hypothetical protein